MAAPGSRLHGASDNGASAGCASVRGSAAAPVKDPSGAVPIAPARMTPRPSSARRSSKPLPATVSMGEDFPLLVCRLYTGLQGVMLMILLACQWGDCYGASKD